MKIRTIPYFNILLLLLMTFVSGCNGCSKSAQKQRLNSSETSSQSKRAPNNTSGKTIVKMEKQNGVYQIPVEVNGVKMYFIFDTGASTISISETEAIFLYKQGSLAKEDILGTANFIDAKGEISEGTIINLKTVKIGDKTLYNIRASVVHNLNAPLLFGQSALEVFGKISIDNSRGEITFE
jgi:aspartyl protease family protein